MCSPRRCSNGINPSSISAGGPRVRILFPPAASHQRTTHCDQTYLSTGIRLAFSPVSTPERKCISGPESRMSAGDCVSAVVHRALARKRHANCPKPRGSTPYILRCCISCDAALELPELLGIGLSLRERADRSEPGELACHRFAAVEHLRCFARLICSARDGSRAQSQHVRSRGSQAPANRLRRISLRRVRGPQGRSQSAAHQSARLADIASP